MLQPTSPIRNPKDLIEGLKKFYKFQHDSLWSVSVVEKSIIRLNNLLSIKINFPILIKKEKK